MYADDTNVPPILTKANDIYVELILEFVKICNRLVTNKLSLDILEAEYMIIGIEQALIQLGSIPKICNRVVTNKLSLDILEAEYMITGIA